MNYIDLILAIKLMMQGMGALFVAMTVVATLVYLLTKSNKH